MTPRGVAASTEEAGMGGVHARTGADVEPGDRALRERAERVLRGNSIGPSTKPARGLYPHQWNWDSCFIAIGIAHYDTDRAATELRSLLRGQWRNGMVPQIVFNPRSRGYFPGPDVWQSSRSPNAPSAVQTSGITQPPVLAIAAYQIWENARDKDTALEILRDLYPRIRRFHEFLHNERCPDGDGLVVVIHPWESGLDNSPPYLVAGERVQMRYTPTYTRLDTTHVNPRYRPTNKQYDLFVYLLEQMRAADWDQSLSPEAAPLQVKDVLFNAILCRADADLARIAELLGDDPAPIHEWREQTARSINAKLWDEASGLYFSYDRVARTHLKERTIACLVSLFGGVAPQDRADRLIAAHLQNPEQFWPRGGYPVPSTVLRSRWFNPIQYWLGPVWVSTNWMLVRGLEKYGRVDLAHSLADITIGLVRKHGFREYFNPKTGIGYGAHSFSWTAALTIDLIDRPPASGH